MCPALASNSHMYLDVPEVSMEAASFPGAHRRVVETGGHELGHPLVPELHPALRVVLGPCSCDILLPLPHKTLWGVGAEAIGQPLQYVPGILIPPKMRTALGWSGWGTVE